MNTGGPSFPNHETTSTGEPFHDHLGMTLLDWMAGQALTSRGMYGANVREKEVAKECYDIASAMLAEKARREAGHSEDKLGKDHSPDAGKMVQDQFAETTLRRLAADVLPADIKDAANEQLPSWCAEQVRAHVNTLEAANRELVEALESLDVWGDELDGNLCPPDSNCSCHISPPCNDCTDFAGQREAKRGWEDAQKRARAVLAKAKGVA